MQKFTLYLLFLLLGLSSCKFSSDDPTITKLYDEVMVIHDDVMPEMSTIRKLKKSLLKIDQPANKTQIDASVKNLKIASEEMMDWMAEFKVPKDDNTQEQQSYLEKEKISISNVKTAMENAITEAKEILNENEK